MKDLNQRRQEYALRLKDVADVEAWGSARGALAFAKINSQLLNLPDHTLVILDFVGIARADVSFLREAVIETLRKFRPRLLFVANGLKDSDLRMNLESALTLQDESLLLRRAHTHPQVLGRQLPKEHELTLHTLQGYPEFTSGMLTAEPFKLESSTASARLTTLWKAGLVDRVHGTAVSGGKEYKYFPVR
jgi:hypothetical protein